MTYNNFIDGLIRFDKILSGWKRFIALMMVFSAMYFLPEGTAQHVVAAFGLFIGTMGFAAKKVSE